MIRDDDSAAFDARIEALTRALDESPDAGARRSARELVTLVLDFHRRGLRRILDVLSEEPVNARQQVANDPVIGALLALHELEFPKGITGAPGTSGGPLIQITRRAGVPSPMAPALHATESPQCELCGVSIDEPHSHFVDLVTRRVACSCRACWLLRRSDTTPGSMRAVPDRYVGGPALRVTSAQWDALQLPVATAFFMFNSAAGRTIAFYPSPAGATESALTLAAWRDIERSNEWLRTAMPDVEAILLRQHGREMDRYDAFIVPIDACYDLVGRIRMNWSGFDGGDLVRAEIDRFFREVAARSAGVEPLHVQ